METIEKRETALIGMMMGFKANKHGDIDESEFFVGRGTQKINFAPHTAEVITDALKTGDGVQLAYTEEEPESLSKHNEKLQLQSLNRPERPEIKIKDIHPLKADLGQEPEELLFESLGLVEGKRNELTGLRSGNKVVHISQNDKLWPDHISFNLWPEVFTIKRTRDRFVNINHDNVYYPTTITIKGKIYHTKKSL